ncbi:MAG: ABC transporter permease subunit [Chloroflexi bacterium]|nr:ABC transporter permease subunit [Chloroflexota bacterium]
MTLLGLALRSHLGGFAATAFFGLLLGLAITLAFAQTAGNDPASRALFARQMEIVGRQLSYFLPLPAELDTMSGFVQWRLFGAAPLIYAFWALLAGSGAGRGDEERGLVEMWLAAGVSRFRYIVTRWAAFLLVATAAVAVLIAGTWAGSVAADEPIDIGPLALQGLALLALTAFCFAFTAVVAQLTTTRRSAGGAAGIGLMVLFLVNSASRSGGLEAVAPISPFWQYDRSTPLRSAGTLDGAAVGLLLGATAVLLVAATLAFRARDLGASLLRTAPRAGRRKMRPSGDPLLRLPVFALLDQQRYWILGWAIGLAALAAFLTTLTRLMVDSLFAIPTLRVFFERLGSSGYDSFVGIIWGSTAALLLSLFAIFQVNGWVSDDAEGRLEAALAQPIARTRVVLERLASIVLATLIIAAAAAAAVWVTAAIVDIPLTADRFFTGSALMVTVPLAFGAIGAVVSSWRPRAAVPLLTVIAIVGYFTEQFTPLFEWPPWVENTSLYALYGTPIATGVEWGGTLTLVAIGIAGAALGLVLFQRRDVGR